jgi:hypothetical protein
MNNAPLIYDSLKNFNDIKGLVGKQEDIFLDFKESRTATGALLDDDKAQFSKAASGFAHQEGGVLVWGMEAREGPDGTDQAMALKPIANIKKFLSGLNDYVKYSTEPVIDGIQNRLIYDDNDENSNKGYAVTFFPKSASEHRALGNTKHDFYKRYGHSFVPLSTADIRALFLRNFSPDLELRVAREGGLLRFSLYNKGRGVAKYPSVLIGLIPYVSGRWFDGGGQPQPFKIGWMEFGLEGPYSFQYMTNAGVVVHPEQELSILRGPGQMIPQRTEVSKVSKVVYRLFAENMVPKEGTLEL